MKDVRKKSAYKPLPISDEAYAQLEKKYGVPQETLRQMAKELGFARPKLEMHLIVLANEARKKNQEFVLRTNMNTRE